MNANDNVTVRIVGDASGVPPAIAQTQGALGGLEGMLAELNATMKGMTAQMVEGFAKVSASIEALGGHVRNVKHDVDTTQAGFMGMFNRLHEGAESIRTFQMRAKAFAEVYVAMFAVDRVAEWIAKMGEASEHVQHLSQQFGMPIAQVQQLQGVATATGISIDALTRGMGFLDRNLATAAAGSKRMKSTMDQVGISFSDGRSQMEKLAVVADKFKNMDDGPKKVALAMALFGKSGRELIPVLNLGRDGIEQLNAKMDEYGVRNEAAVQKGVALAESVNETKLGFMGIGNVLTDALAPAFKMLVDGVNDMIKAFIQSYKEGGLVKVILDVIGSAIKITVQVVEALGEIFSEVWSVIAEVGSEIGSLLQYVFGKSAPDSISATDQALNFLMSVVVLTKDLILDFVDVVGGAFKETAQVVMTFGKIAYDALTLHWGSIEGDWSEGLANIRGMVEQTANQIRSRATEMSAAFHGTLKFPAGKTGVELPKGSGDFDYNPSAGGGKAKKPKDDLVQRLEQELEEKKAAWEKEQLAQDTAQQFSLESEAAFWDQALKRHNLSAKDRFEITKKWIAAEKALQSDRIAVVLEGDKRELFEADKNAQAKLAIVEKEAAFIRKTYGDRSKEARAADFAVLQAEREAADQQIQLINAVAKARADAANAQVDEAEKSTELEEQLGLISQGKLLALDRQFEQQRYQIELQGLQQRRSLIDRNRDPAGYQQVSLQIEALERQHQEKLTQIDRQAVLQRTAIERSGIQQVGQTFGDHISKMITLQEGWRTGLIGIYQGLVQTVASVVQQMIEKWIILHLTKLLLGKQEAVQNVANYVAQAGAGGVASMAAAPFPIDLTAPAFGASMAAAAAGFGSVAAAEGGDWNVSEGLYHLHEQEMVLPAWAASPLRSMLMDGGAAASSSGKSAAGDSHFTYSPTHNHRGASWEEFEKNHAREMRRWFKRQVLNGALSRRQAA